MSATTEQRREAILEELLGSKKVMVRDLADELSVSEATVRRDLKALADEGQVELVYGGAILPRRSDFSFRSKAVRNVDDKRVIGRLAGERVGDGDQILIDSGTTCFQMVPALKATRGVSVIVNSARLALELDTPALSVILLGGQYRPDRMDTVGPLAGATLEQLHGYVAFISADGLSMDVGLTASDIESADLYRRAVANARRTVLLADSSKFESASLFKIVDFDAISCVITERAPRPAWMEFFRENQIEVVCPDEGSSGQAADA
ncbi:MAG: DeoR/GlpR family DNA-binding transcription regulator [Planctomycetota bacterium]